MSEKSWGGGYDDMLLTLAESNLGTPPIPKKLRARISRTAPWVWATRSIQSSEMYMFRSYIDEFFQQPVEDYAAVSHAGHGSNSYGINLHLVYGPLAIFAQDGWGGVYMNAQECAESVAETFRLAGQLLRRVEDARNCQGKLVILWSSFRGNHEYAVVGREAGAAPAPASWTKCEVKRELFESAGQEFFAL